MLNPRKYMLFSALAVPAIYACAPPSVKEMAKPRWLYDISVAISTSLAAKPEAEVSSVDPIAAAKVDEDLDYRIAERTRSTEGWRAFLAAHPDGPHSQSARAELDKLAPPVTPAAPAAAPVPDVGAADAKIPIPSASVSPPPQSTESDAATVASDEICRGDEDRLQRLSDSPTSDGILRLLIELRCEKLRPQLLGLAKRLDDKPPATTADAAQDASSSVLPRSVVSAPPLPPPRMRADEPSKRPRSTLSSRGVESKGHATQRTAPNLPQFLLAFFGGGPRNSTGVRRVQAASGPGSGGGGH
jgi:hypothetical protein